MIDFPVIDEIKSEYITLRENGYSRSNATEMLIDQYKNEIVQGEEDDGILFWIAIADAQLKCKELDLEIATQGLAAIDHILTTDTHHIFDVKKMQNRMIAYSLAPMPENHRIKKRKKYRSTWKKGDAFSVAITGELASKMGLLGKYFIIRVIETIEFGDGRLLPVVAISVWKYPNLPSSESELNSVPFLKLRKKVKQNKNDLYEYRVQIVFSNQKQIELLHANFIGNFPCIHLPNDEYVPSDPGSMQMILPISFMDDCCTYWRFDYYYRTGLDCFV